MTIASRELFELCKQVYEATGWSQEADISLLYKYWDNYDELCVISIEEADDALVPAYTSDYLLEKLPRRIETAEPLVPSIGSDKECVLTLSEDTDKEGWVAGYDSVYGKKGVYWQLSDTPLKALLKLTIKLQEEGLL